MNCIFIQIDKSQISIIKPLWEKLNILHLNNSHYFKEYYSNLTFEKRCEKFNKLDNCNVFIEIIKNEINSIPIGYCVSTKGKSVGEIDSLFIEEEYRKYGYGQKLVENSLKWFKENNCNKIMVAVAEGHESVFRFYEKFGFYPKMTYLQLKE